MAFLAKLQRLFAQGEFTATYKFALLIALADLAVECGRDDGDPLRLTTRQIAEKFVELYWQQSLTYCIGSRPMGVLAQNSGTQAAVVTAIGTFRQTDELGRRDPAEGSYRGLPGPSGRSMA